MNGCHESKNARVVVANLGNRQAIAFMDVGKGREQDAEALPAIRALMHRDVRMPWPQGCGVTVKRMLLNLISTRLELIRGSLREPADA